MTLKEITDNELNIFSALLASDDSRLNTRQLAFWTHQYRNKLMNQFTDYGKDINNSLWQDLGIWELERVDKAESNGTLPFGTYIRKSVYKVPDFITFPNNRGIFVGATDKQHGYTVATPNNILQKASNKYAQAMGLKWWYILNNYVYIVGCAESDNTDQKWFNIRGVLKDPTQGNYFYPNHTSGIAYNMNTDSYPIYDEMLDAITTLIAQKEFGIESLVRPDLQNNAQEDSQFSPPKQRKTR